MSKPKKEYSELEVLLDVPYQDEINELLEKIRQTPGMFDAPRILVVPPPQEPEDE